ncbi:proline iminopeptidase [Mytilinidion resinicola]|uniref:Proline iminopeptidase n=1 Tax=Mytilinidion resinicola TaxID=574789 RepID=A0A6A6Z259_9PEZI|nr:proline iminopeptidase [Mytilinidion resinicola]KAF2815191.1 proline iminopeptidase [Mytilinidion resinicola]
MAMVNAAKILSQKTYQVPGKLKITEHFFEVPRDYSNPSSGPLQLFARSCQKHEKPASGPDPEADKKSAQLPWLVYLQGGPGFECGSPQNSAWTNAVLDKGYQVLCLDQRGTGLSSPLCASSLGLRGDENVQAKYMKSFRADSIVKDCEAIRKALTKDFEGGEEKKKWTVMGQSFGGFCAVTYLSFFPEGLREVFLFGGLPPMVDKPDEVYKRLYKRVTERNEAYYRKYPEDVKRVKAIVKLLQRFGDSTVRTPSGGSLSARRFQKMGLLFGRHGGIDGVHEIVLRASTDLDQVGHLTRGTVSAIEQTDSFDDNIIYSMLHEPVYCQGQPSNWSAERLLPAFPQFALTTPGPIHFTGEMIYPFMFDTYAELAKLSHVAHKLAADPDWPALYDLDQLAKNEVPVYAAVYLNDMYVDYDLSVDTASRIKGCETFVTNALYHNAVRAKVDDVLKGVWALRDDVID